MLSETESVTPTHLFYALGVGCFGLGTIHFLTDGWGLGNGLETLMIWALSGSVLYIGSTLVDREISRAGQWEALALSVGLVVSFTLLAFAVWVAWYTEGTETELSFLLAFAATLGAVVGSQSSLYAVQSKEQLTQARELAKLLKVNQRVLRHNLRNELAIALGHLENIENAGEGDDTTHDTRIVREHLEELLDTSERARRIVTIWETDEVTDFDLVSLLHDRIARFEDEYPDVRITTDLPDGCHVTAHPALSSAVDETLENAIEHTPADASVDVRLETGTDGGTLLTIADDGTGMSSVDREAISLSEETPLSHTRGLGLWIIYWVVEKSGGTLTFAENEPHGTAVRIRFAAS